MAEQTEELRDSIARALYANRMGFDHTRWTPDRQAIEAADAVLAVLPQQPTYEQVGMSWCLRHGSASCPEQYMLLSDGSVAPGYQSGWSESLRCGQRVPLYRVVSSPVVETPEVVEVWGTNGALPETDTEGASSSPVASSTPVAPIVPPGRVLDDHDHAFYTEAFILADAVRRFLVRVQTRRVIDAGMLDEDVVNDLVSSADRIWLIRTQRVAAARALSPQEETP